MEKLRKVIWVFSENMVFRKTVFKDSLHNEESS